LLLDQARNADAVRRGNWRDFVILAVLGLAIALRWFEPAWPHGLAAFGKMLLLDAGIYGFLVVRQLDGVVFDLRLKGRDAVLGLREFVLFAVLAIPLGLGLGFLHFHSGWPQPLRAVGAFVFTFLFIAIPEELFFRGWLQNSLERRMGRTAALVVTAILFGLAHWNKRTASFNWRYVLLAAIAGIFYGRAWRAQRRVGASAITHATVDTLWSLWLR
jgi:membrane protease YdiL (CAAX protease family)